MTPPQPKEIPQGVLFNVLMPLPTKRIVAAAIAIAACRSEESWFEALVDVYEKLSAEEG